MRKIIIIALACLTLIGVEFSVFAQNGKNRITFDDVFRNGTFRSKSIHGLRSMNDGIHYTTVENGRAIVKFSYKTGASADTILKVDELNNESFQHIGDYSFSDDESKIMLSIDRESIYRHSFVADFYIWDMEAENLIRLSENGKQQLASFSPDGKKVAFVRDNNIFITDLETNQELQFTFDGEKNSIINGAPDWVYEEEFGFSKAFAWSPDGGKLAFIRFDERDVKEFNMTMFAGEKPQLSENELYPENRSWKYPKAGEDNSIVSVHVYNLISGKTVIMDIGDETDQYVPRIRWTNNSNTLCIFRLNRLQNKLEFIFADIATGVSKVIYTDENKYYIDENNYDYLTFTKDGKYFIVLNETDGWNHIYLYTIDGELVEKVTKEEYDVQDFYGFDETNRIFYFQSAERSPVDRDIYSIKWDGTGKKRLSGQKGVNRASFSKGFQYYINYFSNAETPTQVTLRDSKGKMIRVLEGNDELMKKLKEYKFSTKEFFEFTTSEGVKLNGYIIYPPDFNKNNQYPVFMTQYSGPNSQSALNSWDLGWNTYLAQEGYIVACVDGRGTGARGEEFRKMTYLQLGKYETIDQIEAAKYFGSLPFVDQARIGIWGWSYGGFTTLLCMTKGEGTFKVGVAVAPVTHWKYYDNIYTERFMRTPQENPAGYDDNAPISFAGQLEGHLLIIHGSADDNVHVQNTMEFTEALVQADKDFEMMIYTNRNHGIYGGKTKYQLFRKINNFVMENL